MCLFKRLYTYVCMYIDWRTMWLFSIYLCMYISYMCPYWIYTLEVFLSKKRPYELGDTRIHSPTHLYYLLNYFYMRFFASKIIVIFYRAWHGRILNSQNYFAVNFSSHRRKYRTNPNQNMKRKRVLRGRLIAGNWAGASSNTVDELAMALASGAEEVTKYHIRGCCSLVCTALLSQLSLCSFISYSGLRTWYEHWPLSCILSSFVSLFIFFCFEWDICLWFSAIAFVIRLCDLL